MSGLFKGKTFSSVGDVGKILAGVAAGAAVIFTAGSALGVTGSLSDAASSATQALGLDSNSGVGAVLTGALEQASVGAAVGMGAAAATGGDIGQGGLIGLGTGAVTGGLTGAIDPSLVNPTPSASVSDTGGALTSDTTPASDAAAAAASTAPASVASDAVQNVGPLDTGVTPATAATTGDTGIKGLIDATNAGGSGAAASAVGTGGTVGPDTSMPQAVQATDAATPDVNQTTTVTPVAPGAQPTANALSPVNNATTARLSAIDNLKVDPSLGSSLKAPAPTADQSGVMSFLNKNPAVATVGGSAIAGLGKGLIDYATAGSTEQAAINLAAAKQGLISSNYGTGATATPAAPVGLVAPSVNAAPVVRPSPQLAFDPKAISGNGHYAYDMKSGKILWVQGGS